MRLAQRSRYIQSVLPRRRYNGPTLNLPPDSPFLSDKIARRIGFRAARLRRKNGLCSHDELDLRQDFWLNLLQAAARFDPEKCSLHRYVSMILNSRYKHHVRELARKNEDTVGLAESETCSLEGLGEEGHLIRDEAVEQNLPRAVLVHDVKVVLDLLSDGDRKICMVIMEHGTPGEAARALGMSHWDIYRVLERLRTIFERRNLIENF